MPKIVKDECLNFDENLEFNKPLLYQNYNSLKLTQLAGKLSKFFPNLGPQDLYKYQNINNLIKNYGILQSNLQEKLLQKNFR